MSAVSTPKLKRLARSWPWLGGCTLVLVAVLMLGLQASNVASERSDLDSLMQRLVQGRLLRDQLKAEGDPAKAPIIHVSPQRSLAASLRQRVEQAGPGLVQVAQLQLLERRKGERFDLNVFNLTAQLPARELDRWLFNLEHLSPELLIDRAEVRLATSPLAPIETRMLQIVINGRVIVDDQNAKP